MEVEEIQAQTCKFPRVVGNGRTDPQKIGQKGGRGAGDHDKDGDLKVVPSCRGNNDLVAGVNCINGFRGWNHSSRIIRVSRTSGGKDRHSKVMTSKGMRDRRVRLSVSTAIQFYDLQDRLGYDQPSKAVEWLIKAAADAISELPPLNNPFPETPRQPSDEKRTKGESPNQGLDSAEIEIDDEGDANFQQQQNPPLSLSKSACSSTSETSKGSGLSLSRSEIRENRVRRRERARERTAKEKENEPRISIHNAVNPIPHHSSFTELLTGGVNNNQAARPTGSANHFEPNLFQKPTHMDYFGTGLLGQSSSRINHSPPYQTQLGNSHLSQAMSFNVAGDNNHSELQHFPFVFDPLIPAAAAATTQPGAVDYNLNFTISSSGMAPGFSNRGTLQSNSSPSLLPHFQRFSSPLDGSNVPFFISSAAPPLENHHQFTSGFDGRLQLYYGDGNRHPDQKGKGKN